MVTWAGRVSYFLEPDSALLAQVALQYIDLRRQGRCRDLSLILRFGMLPSVLPVRDFRASEFLPSKLDWRQTQLGTTVHLLLLMT